MATVLAVLFCLICVFVVATAYISGFDVILLLFSPDKPIDGFFINIADIIWYQLGIVGIFVPLFLYVFPILSALMFRSGDDEAARKLTLSGFASFGSGMLISRLAAPLLPDAAFAPLGAGLRGRWAWDCAPWLSVTAALLSAALLLSCFIVPAVWLCFAKKRAAEIAEEKKARQVEEEERKKQEQKAKPKRAPKPKTVAKSAKTTEKPYVIDGEWYDWMDDVFAGKIPVSAIEVDGVTSLMHACEHCGSGSSSPARYEGYKAVRKLIEMGADVNAQDRLGRTPLFYAAECVEGKIAQAHITQILLDAGADINIESHDGTTPISQAAKARNFNLVYMYCQKNAAVRSKNAAYTLLKSAVETDDTGFLKYICSKINPKIKSENNETLLFSCPLSPDNAALLIKAGVDPNELNDSGRNCLFNQGYLDTFEILLKAGANPNVHDKNGKTPLMEAPSSQILLLIKYGADVNAYDNKGYSVLHHVVLPDTNGRRCAAKLYLLLKAGANPNVEAPDKEYRAFLAGNKNIPLNWALRHSGLGGQDGKDYFLCVRMLLKAGAIVSGDYNERYKERIQKARETNKKSDPFDEAETLLQDDLAHGRDNIGYHNLEVNPADEDVSKDVSKIMKELDSNYVIGLGNAKRDEKTGALTSQDNLSAVSFWLYAVLHLEKYSPLFYSGNPEQTAGLIAHTIKNGGQFIVFDINGALKPYADKCRYVSSEFAATSFVNDMYSALKQNKSLEAEGVYFFNDFDFVNTVIPTEELEWFFAAARERKIYFIATIDTHADEFSPLFKHLGKSFSFVGFNYWYQKDETEWRIKTANGIFDFVFSDAIAETLSPDMRLMTTQELLNNTAEENTESIDDNDVNAPDENGVTPLMRAMRIDGDTRAVRKLLNAGANVDAKDDDGDTALQYAFDVECVRMLIESGADIHTENDNGETLLQNACSPEYAQFLIDQGLDVDTCDKDGDTPLTSCLVSRFKDNAETELKTVKVLLNAGADVNAANKDGKTALILAAELTKYKRPLRFVLQALKLLKEAGADINHTDKKGNSALSIVQKIDNAEAIQILSK